MERLSSEIENDRSLFLPVNRWTAKEGYKEGMMLCFQNR